MLTVTEALAQGWEVFDRRPNASDPNVVLMRRTQGNAFVLAFALEKAA